MKKVLLFSFWAFSAFTAAFAQTTRVVSNATGYNNGIFNSLVYNNLQTCLDAANEGDVIYVQGSGTSYGDITITKSVALIGPGYFIGQNAAPNTQALAATATLGRVSFGAGSSNSILKGFSLAENIVIQNTGQVIIQNNNLGGYSIFMSNTSNCIIKQNIGCSVTGKWVHNFIGGWLWWENNSGVIVANNIFHCGIQIENATVTNNIFDFDFSGDVYRCDNCSIKNNVFGTGAGSGLNFLDRLGYWGHPYNYYGFINSTVSYNIFRHTPEGGSATNTYNVDANTLFVGYPTGGYSADGKFQLKAGSPAIGAGEDGVDCGAFGGNEPYKLSGMGFNPNIFKVQMPNTGTSQGGLPVKVQIQANH